MAKNNIFKRIFGIPETQTNQQPTTPIEQEVRKNNIANEFLRRGNLKARNRVRQDKDYDEEATLRGYLYAALECRRNAFAEYAEQNIVCDDKQDSRIAHPYLNLIENSKVEDEYDFWSGLISDYDMHGVAYMFVLRRVVYGERDKYGNRKIEHIGLPVSIERVSASKMEAIKDSSGKIVAYKQRIDSNHIRELFADQVIRICNWNPLEPDQFLSIFDACKDYQYTINKGSEFAQAALINNINTPGIIGTENQLTDQEYDNLVSRLNGHEAGKVIVTDGVSKLNYTPMNQELDKAALPTLTEMNRQTIFAVTGTSKTILGIEESGVTRETAKVQNNKFTQRTIKPLVKKFVSAMNFDYRLHYPEAYKSTNAQLTLRNASEPLEDIDRYNANKMFFDDVQYIVGSGFRADDAEKFMNGELDYTEMRDAEIDEMQDETDQKAEEEADKKSQDGNQGSGTAKKAEPAESADDTKNGLTAQELETVVLENEVTGEHNHTDSDDYLDKVLVNYYVEGELSDYGKLLKSQTEKAKNDLLKGIRSAQLEAIQMANSKLTVNAFEQDDISSEDERNTIFEKIFNLFKRYWMFMIPLIGKERIKEDKENLKDQINVEVEVNLLGTADVNDYIKKTSENAAKSHTHTIFSDILKAANIGFQKAADNLFATKYLEQWKPSEDKWFKTKPTEKEIKSKLKNEQFKSENKELYAYVQEQIQAGYNRAEINKLVRKEYVNLSRKRANALVGNEMAKAINSSQFIADYELLKATNNLSNAYKRLVSNSGTPCPICEEIINRGEIPFAENFVNLGDSITAKDGNGKSETMVFNYEPIRDGVVHPNCHCRYELIIKEKKTDE